MRTKASRGGGKICRDGINCRVVTALEPPENLYFIELLTMARRLLTCFAKVNAATRPLSEL
jgi:hypothetical protein